MSVTPSSPIVGVFRDRSVAIQAIDALRNADFEPEQIQYSGPASSGRFSEDLKSFFTAHPRPARLPGQSLGRPFEDLKSFFTGTNHSEGNLVYNLTNMGLSNSEVHHYSNEYKNGNTILAVRAPGREREVASILQRYGAYNAGGMRPGLSQGATNTAQQPSDFRQQDNYRTQEQQNSIQDEETERRYVNTDESAFIDNPPDSGGSDNRYDADPQHEQSGSVTSESSMRYQLPRTDGATPRQAAETSTSQTSPASAGTTDELRQLQAQIQAAQQQLQEAKAELQAAREREAQVRSAKEHEQQLQDAREQLRAIQAELESTRVELRESQEHVAQYR